MVEAHIIDFIELKGENHGIFLFITFTKIVFSHNIFCILGLGYYSEQAQESVHHNFKVIFIIFY